MNLQVSLQAMTDDAALWSTSAATLRAAGTSAGGLTIPDYAFSFAGGTVSTKYEEVRAFVEQYLQDGATQQQDASAALTEIRDDFASTDQTEADQYAGSWDPA